MPATDRPEEDRVMYSIALALSTLALEEAVASARDEIRATQPDPAPLDAAGRAAQAMAWRRWAAEGREGLAAASAGHEGGSSRQPGPVSWLQIILGGRSPARR